MSLRAAVRLSAPGWLPWVLTLFIGFMAGVAADYPFAVGMAAVHVARWLMVAGAVFLIAGFALLFLSLAGLWPHARRGSSTRGV